MACQQKASTRRDSVITAPTISRSKQPQLTQVGGGSIPKASVRGTADLHRQRNPQAQARPPSTGSVRSPANHAGHGLPPQYAASVRSNWQQLTRPRHVFGCTISVSSWPVDRFLFAGTMPGLITPRLGHHQGKSGLATTWDALNEHARSLADGLAESSSRSFERNTLPPRATVPKPRLWRRFAASARWRPWTSKARPSNRN